MHQIKLSHIVVLILLLATFLACIRFKHNFRSSYEDATQLLHATDTKNRLYLKAHHRNGSVYILRDSWHIDTVSNTMTGDGDVYDYHRKLVGQGSHSVPIDSVLIFETNKKLNTADESRILGLSVLAGLNVAGAIYCMLYPKSCFGSCPTFYIDDTDDFYYADAEGFSNAIAPSLAYADIDALNAHRVKSNFFSITMKNEALETHCVQELQLLAYPLQVGERVYHTRSDDFYLCEGTYPLKRALTIGQDITALLDKEDRVEWFSLADDSDLKRKEEIYLTFENVNTSDTLGLLLHYRQTLMTTYFIYSALDYMGGAVGDIFAQIEKNERARTEMGRGIYRELGDVDVYLWHEREQEWMHQGGFYETGPIAINRQLLPLQIAPADATIKLKLVLNKGLWRLDYAALTTIKAKVTPLALAPVHILNQGEVDTDALARLTHIDQQLVTVPGSVYRIDFQLPEKDAEYDLFLRSKGYYLEWMRAAWMQDKNLRKLKQMITRPRKYLREEARAFKEYERSMEEKFWNSKVTTNPLTYHESE